MPDNKPKFDIGAFVRRKSNPDMGGIIVNQVFNDQMDCQEYKVRFANNLRGVPEGDLELIPDHMDPWHDLLEGKYAASQQAFVELMTYERLRKPPTRIAAVAIH